MNRNTGRMPGESDRDVVARVVVVPAIHHHRR